jgi:hypothetical protein
MPLPRSARSPWLDRSWLHGQAGFQFNEQGPLPHGPASHPPGPGPHAPAPHPEKEGVGAEVATAKTDSCFSTSLLSQEGQETSSPKRRTSFSKCFPQLQAYS